MAAISGKEGKITWAGKLPSGAPIRGWSADIIVDMFDASSLESDTAPTGRQRITGLMDATGTISFVQPSGGASTILPGGAAVTLSLYPDTGGDPYIFDAILSGVHPSLEVGGENLLTFDFQMSDKLGVH